MNDEILAEVNYGIAWAKMMNSRGHSRRNKAPIFFNTEASETRVEIA